MKRGDLCPMTSCSIRLGTTILGYKAPKGKQFVFLLLGMENKDGTEPLDPEKTLSEMGWRLK